LEREDIRKRVLGNPIWLGFRRIDATQTVLWPSRMAKKYWVVSPNVRNNQETVHLKITCDWISRTLICKTNAIGAAYL
jgi:hypothetical protein